MSPRTIPPAESAHPPAVCCARCGHWPATHLRVTTRGTREQLCCSCAHPPPVDPTRGAQTAADVDDTVAALVEQDWPPELRG